MIRWAAADTSTIFQGFLPGTTTRVTNLNYAYFAVDPTSFACVTIPAPFPGGPDFTYCFYTRYTYDYGWGQIPNSDAQINPDWAGVDTTVTNGPNFNAQECTYDFLAFTVNCTNTAGGTVDARWGKDNGYKTFQSGTIQNTYGSFSFKTMGTAWSSSATASGSLLGHAFANAFGRFSDTHSVNVSKDVVSGP